MSTTESKYIAASQTPKEMVCVEKLFDDTAKDKQIEVKYHINQQPYEGRNFELAYMHMNDRIADILTKPFNKTRLENLRTELGVRAETKYMSTQGGSMK